MNVFGNLRLEDGLGFEHERFSVPYKSMWADRDRNCSECGFGGFASTTADPNISRDLDETDHCPVFV
jgi:hypothetical protein